MRYALLAHVSSSNSPEVGSAITSGWELFWAAWQWDTLAITAFVVAQVLYLYWVKLKWNRKTFYFTLGNLIILIALVSPIATIGETYLFSVHMVQHLLLEIVAVPLLIIGLPAKVAAKPMRWAWFRKLAKLLGNPWLAWMIGVGTLWVWHMPLLYNLTLETRGIHILEHAMFMISATIFWYAVLDPIEKFRLSTFPAIAYLFSACFVNSLLAIFLTFAPVGIYPYYLNPTDKLGALTFIREVWGIIPEVDQQAGGAIMWVFGGVIFLWALLGVLVRWFQSPDEEVILPSSPRRKLHAS